MADGKLSMTDGERQIRDDSALVRWFAHSLLLAPAQRSNVRAGVH
jgi:hypothetical protein